MCCKVHLQMILFGAMKIMINLQVQMEMISWSGEMMPM